MVHSNSDDKARIEIADYDAFIFDLDGVVTATASVHASAWKRMFDDFLSRYAERTGEPFREFDINTDYLQYVDGIPRVDGVRAFLASREIDLPEGTPQDGPDDETVYGLGNLKNQYFLDDLKKKGPKVYQSTVDLIKRLRTAGLKTAIISSSKNCAEILETVDLMDRFDVRVDGVISEKLGIAGKPEPDIFLAAAQQLSVSPARAVVIEDAISGVQAGRAGHFGLVVGVARAGD